MEIAVLVDADGRAADFKTGGTVNVYEIGEQGFHLMRKKQYVSVASKGAPVIRASLKELGEWLGSCKVLVARELNGIYFTVLEGLLFNMWEMTGFPQDFLDYIYKGELAEKEKTQLPEKKYAPVEKGRGVFVIDLDTVMNNDSGLTSKKVLLPFLQKENFKKLEVKCNHIPRWFEVELPGLKLKALAEKQDDGYLVTLLPESL